ncbi:MAG: amino acid adenylation domain-containing protein, partial [Methylococcales bacterium]|nr:amino acid adenylation domain-containing protein [Methylococcales bacterium]
LQRRKSQPESRVFATGSLVDGFLRAAEKYPQQIAIQTATHRFTYSQILQQSQVVSQQLLKQGVQPNQLVAIIADKGWLQIVASIGVLLSGAAYCPIDPNLPSQRILQLLQDGHVQSVLTQQRLITSLEWPLGIELLAVDGELPPLNPELPVMVKINHNDLAYVIYTSGSTGLPKGVMMSHKATLNTLEDVSSRFAVTDNDRVFAISSLSFDLSVFDIFATLAVGATIVMPDADGTRDARHWGELIQQYKVTVWNSAPPLMQMLLESQKQTQYTALQSLRLIMLSGDWIPVEMADICLEINDDIQVISLGGATEAAIWSIYYPIEQSFAGQPSIPYGYSLANQKVEVFSPTLQPCPNWVVGDIVISGVGLSKGYWKDKDKTLSQFIKHPETGVRYYKTGDLGRYHPDGYIEFLGREDAQVKIQGYRIELGEIEFSLLQHDAVVKAVVEVQDVTGQRQIVAYVVLSDNVESSALMRHCQTLLPSYMVPKHIMPLADIPLTVNGKVDRKALPVPRQPVSPVLIDEFGLTQTQQWLSDKLQSHLGLIAADLSGQFFQLGGDSLSATRIVAEADVELHKALSLRHFFDNALSLRDIAQILDEAVEVKGAAHWPELTHDLAQANTEFALNPIQQAYWYGRQPGLELGGVSCHLYMEIDSLSVDVVDLQQAWNHVVARHPMLRTVITDDGLQHCLESVDEYEFEQCDFQTLEGRVLAEVLTSQRNELAAQVIDVATWPLFEIRVLLLPDNKKRILFSFDLLIADVYSVLLILQDWQQFYQYPNQTLPVLPVTFRDYVLAEQDLIQQDYFHAAKEYWQQRLESLPDAPQIPLARQPKTIFAPTFERLICQLDKAQWASFRVLAKDLGVTPSLLLCQVYVDVLQKWSGQAACLLNLTLFNRLPLHASVESIVGDFTSVLLLEVAENKGRFSERLQRLQQQLVADLEHRHFNGIELLRQKRQQGHGMAAPIVFTSAIPLQGEAESLTSIDWLGERVYSITQTPQVWLDHQVFEEAGGLVLSWDYVAELFPETLMSQMFSEYEKALLRLIEQPSCAQSPSVLSPQAMVKTPLKNSSDKLLVDDFVHYASLHPEAIAVVTSEYELTYGEIDDHSNALAHQLIQANVESGDLVAIVIPKGWEHIVAVFAILRSGAAYVPIDVSWPEKRIQALLTRCRCRFVMTTVAINEQFAWPEHIETTYCIDDSQMLATEGAVVTPCYPDDLAYVIFTSGSTGEPKGVVVTHKMAVNTIDAVNQLYQVNQDDRAIALSQLSFDLSVYDIFGLLSVGGAVVMPEADQVKEPEHWLSLLSHEHITLWNTAPAFMQMLLDYTDGQRLTILDDLRVVMLSGDWIPVGLPDQLWAFNPTTKLYSLGGATEGAIWSIHHPVTQSYQGWTSIPYGQALPNQSVWILDEHMNPCPVWVTGDIYIGGVGVALGYWQDNEKTNAQFIPHPETGERLYRTGDLGRYRDTGDIEFLGRSDFQVKVQGYRIELGEIETLILQSEGVEKAVVVANRADNRVQLVAYLTGSFDLNAVQHHCRASLPEYMMPHDWQVLAALPVSANGKIDRSALPTANVMVESAASVTAAESDTEQWLHDIWCEALQLTEASTTVDFFSLGGDSLIATRIVSQIQQQQGITVSIGTFFRAQTIQQLALVIESETDTSTALKVLDPDLVHRHEPFPLNPIQQVYWLGRESSLELGNIACHLYVEMAIQDLSLEQLERTWQQLIERHDMLRAVITVDGLQQIQEAVAPYQFSHSDESVATVRQRLSHEIHDVHQWPLFTIAVSQEQGARLHFSFDLMIADVFSLMRLFDEWSQLYHGEVLAPVSLSFRDYVLFEQDREAAVLKQHWYYWQDRLDTLPA